MSESPNCCICLDKFSSPALLPCGHCFCLGCIGEYWRIYEACQCPLCKTVFPKRPQLKTDQTPFTQDATVPLKTGEVPCDFCSEKRPAIKSCLVCLASYCAAHLEPHYQKEELGRHLLISVAKNLENCVCMLHGRKLQRFCRTDQSCICSQCAQTEHRGHHIVSISKEAAKQKVRLKRKWMQLQQEIGKRLSEAERLKLSVDVRGENPKVAWVQNKELIRQLEEEVTELQRRKADLELLSQTEDNLRFLQASILTERKLTKKND